MKLPWMSHTDKRLWASAETFTDLGETMACWLEGRIASRPGYAPRYGPDEETAHLVPALATLCRTGYITTCSQPGLTATGMDKRRWEQRAAVEGVVADRETLASLTGAATAAGMLVRINDYSQGGSPQQPVIVTTCDGEPVTAFGSRIGRADMANQWTGLNRRLYSQISTGTYLAIAAPEYGPAGERLWDVLAAVRR